MKVLLDKFEKKKKEKKKVVWGNKNLRLPSATRWSPGIYMAKSSLCLHVAIFDYLETPIGVV